MADEADFGIIVLMRYAYPETRTVVPGSTVIKADCGHRSYISPEGRDFLDSSGSYTICDDCQGYEVLFDRDRDRLTVPGAKRTIYEILGTAEGDQFDAFARDLGIKFQ